MAGDEVSCIELVELVTDYLEDRLDPDVRVRLERHLDGCPGCRNYLEQVTRTIELTGRLRPDDLDPAMVDALVQVFRGWRGDDQRSHHQG